MIHESRGELSDRTLYGQAPSKKQDGRTRRPSRPAPDVPKFGPISYRLDRIQACGSTDWLPSRSIGLDRGNVAPVSGARAAQTWRPEIEIVLSSCTEAKSSSRQALACSLGLNTPFGD